jgi:hypothetical protein
MGRESEKQQEAATFLVSPDYFSVLKVPLLSGRVWNQDENRRGDFVAVLNMVSADCIPGSSMIG